MNRIFGQKRLGKSNVMRHKFLFKSQTSETFPKNTAGRPTTARSGTTISIHSFEIFILIQSIFLLRETFILFLLSPRFLNGAGTRFWTKSAVLLKIAAERNEPKQVAIDSILRRLFMD